MNLGAELFGVGSGGEKYLYHYTSVEKLRGILDSGTLRFSPYLNTNDPLESHFWVTWTRIPGGTDDEIAARREEMKTLLGENFDLRRAVKIACFTQDDSEVNLSMLHRGWARPRMWDQYAEKHAGGCLVLDRAAWEQEIESSLASRGMRVTGQAVAYRNARFGGELDNITLDYEDVKSRGGIGVAQAFVNDHQELFFTKNLDWVSERERRYLVLSDSDYEAVPLASSLRAVVIGPFFPDHEDSVLRFRLDRSGFHHVRVAKLAWRSGAPFTGAGDNRELQLFQPENLRPRADPQRIEDERGGRERLG
ncbi:MAG: DUF2971 domain-containing protein [Sinomonas sp.]|nr:DUF2971 domain-containing protein [Sinomonas sp.]